MLAVMAARVAWMFEMKVDDQRQVVGGVAGQSGVGDPDLADGQGTTGERLIQRGHWPVGGERPEA